MATLGQLAHHFSQSTSRPVRVVRAVLRTYAAILFSRSPFIGLLVLLATATVPRALLFGLLAIVLALGSALLIDLERDAIEDGSYGTSALLLGLGIGQTLGPGVMPFLVLLFLVPLCVLLTAALRSWLGGSNLPLLSIPFLTMFYLLLGVLPILGLAYLPASEDASLLLPPAIAGILRSIGVLLFLPRWDAGAILLLAVLLHSRIALLLAVLGAGTIIALKLALPALAGSEQIGIITLNAVFVAIAIGGVWFVPSPSSILLALLAVLLCTLLALGTTVPLFRLGIPVLIIPFNATVILVLLATRQRAWDRRPKAVDFSPGTPEQNLAYFRTRLLRFRWLYPTRFRLPVRGVWMCTQGVGGTLTHQGRFRYAFDFEVTDLEGKFSASEPTGPGDYYCYKLPVLAAAAGVVTKVESSVPDNEVGKLNLEQNWGNYVIVRHAAGLYSLVAHLQRGSIRVVEGQAVRQGDLLGLCGNSGRSSKPHVHFQLQGGDRLGDATIPCRFTDAVSVAEDQRVHADLCPDEGQYVRNLEVAEERSSYFVFPYRASWVFKTRTIDGSSGNKAADGENVEDSESEQIESDVDPTGQWLLRSSERGACLYFSLTDGFFTAYDSAGLTSPALRILRAALSRVPLDDGERLRWTDYLPARSFRSWIGRVLTDILSPFLHRDGIEMEYQMYRQGTLLIVVGESRNRSGHGEPLLRTRAELMRGSGLLKASLTVRGRTFTMSRESDIVATPNPAPASA